MLIKDERKNYQKFLNNTKSYFSENEKNAVLFILGDNSDIDPIELANILGLSPRNKLEAEAMIFQSRKNSVGEIIELKIKCASCSHEDFYFINIEDMFFKDTLTNTYNFGLLDPYEDNEIFDTFEDISIDEYNKIEKNIIEDNKKIFDPCVDITCTKCNNKMKTTIKFYNIISKFEIKNIYEQYLDLSIYGNFSKKDIDSMIPFERELFLGLIQEKNSKKNQGNVG